MSLVENFVNQITTGELGGITKPQGFDLADDTFAKLLEKNMQIQNIQPVQNDLVAGLGIPSGMFIEPIDAQPVNEIDPIELSKPVEIKDVDFGNDYFSNVIKTEPENHQNLMNLAQKRAAGMYGSIGKSLIWDLEDFANDIVAAK